MSAYQGVDVSFLKNFAYVLNRWSQNKKIGTFPYEHLEYYQTSVMKNLCENN